MKFAPGMKECTGRGSRRRARGRAGGSFLANEQVDPIGDRKWLTLGLARTLLGINEATLRLWADNGLVRAFRTPGGHRRFSAEDIYALIEEDHAVSPTGMYVGGEATVLPSIRRRVKGETRPHTPAWMERFDAEGHERMRGLGREFLDLCIEFVEQPAHTESLEAASALGTTYGTEIASRGIPLGDAMQAFIFFRDATIGAIKPIITRHGATAEQVSAVLEQLTNLTDRVLVSLTACYSQEPLPQPARARKTTRNRR